MSIEGDWNARKAHCGCGYQAVWKVTYVGAGDEEITVNQLEPGTYYLSIYGYLGMVRNTYELTYTQP